MGSYVQDVEDFQQEECAYAKEVAADIGVKLFISGGARGLAQAINFIKSL